MMRDSKGFTLIEVLAFIVISGMLATTIILATMTAAKRSGDVHQQWLTIKTAQNCMEWFVGQRSILGYSSFSCGSTTVPSQCSAPTGYSLSVTIYCNITFDSDSSYKQVLVKAYGPNGAYAYLNTLIGDY
jgi:type II secretory pathway pseudopilin PulG